VVHIYFKFHEVLLASYWENAGDGRTDGRKDGRTDGRTDNAISISPSLFHRRGIIKKEEIFKNRNKSIFKIIENRSHISNVSPAMWASSTILFQMQGTHQTASVAAGVVKCILEPVVANYAFSFYLHFYLQIEKNKQIWLKERCTNESHKIDNKQWSIFSSNENACIFQKHFN